ncbi:MAG TPA: hypothetical protein PLP44_08260 [Methylophilus sp.]|nr:hypothetical protein [Methylophilus sp.]
MHSLKQSLDGQSLWPEASQTSYGTIRILNWSVYDLRVCLVQIFHCGTQRMLYPALRHCG